MMAGLSFIDSHTHLNDDRFAADLSAVIKRGEEAGVAVLINMGDSLASSEKAAMLAKEYQSCYGAVGIHPEEAEELTDRVIDKLAELAQEEKIVAIGEIGLDYYWEKDAERRLHQQKAFICQLDLARQLHLPVCIHNREAHADTLAILKKEGRGLRGALHCFSGSPEMAAEIFRLGYFIGVDGPLTYKNAARLPEVVAKTPKERLLLETDAPYLSPVPHRGKRNEPAYLPLIAQKVADIWGLSLDEVAQITVSNTAELYNLH